MSDISLTFSNGIPDMEIVNGLPKTTKALSNAVYLSLFIPDWWGNAGAPDEEQYDSEIPEIMNTQLLNNQTRLDIIAAATNALAWMQTLGIVTTAPEITAEIPKVGFLYLAVKLTEPEQDDSTDFVYAINWDSQEIELQEAA
ncbi:MAG: hypothetical protein PQJ46_09465 [Spirochaetales bacterium]|nr:hypothetical protein [Spirochaetales bacterium]